MHKANNGESCGIRLINLINTQSLNIAKREVNNTRKMCLYGTGGYWVGFERSAYFLSMIFPCAESFIINNPNYPFAIVGVSISEKELQKYSTTHNASHTKENYAEYEVSHFAPREYGSWHSRKVKEFEGSY